MFSRRKVCIKKEISSMKRILDTLEYRESDYTPYFFMLFNNLFEKCRNQEEFIKGEINMGMYAIVNVGKLTHSMHKDAEIREWAENYM